MRVWGDVNRRVLIGGVGYRWFGDASFGPIASDELGRLDWPDGVEVADLGYGALHVALDLAQAEPPYARVILIAATERGRDKGRLYRWRSDVTLPDADEIQRRVYEAAAGVIDLDHLLVIARHFRGLPDDVVVVELEPLARTMGDRLSQQAEELLRDVIALVRREALSPARQSA